MFCSRETGGWIDQSPIVGHSVAGVQTDIILVEFAFPE